MSKLTKLLNAPKVKPVLPRLEDAKLTSDNTDRLVDVSEMSDEQLLTALEEHVDANPARAYVQTPEELYASAAAVLSSSETSIPKINIDSALVELRLNAKNAINDEDLNILIESGIDDNLCKQALALKYSCSVDTITDEILTGLRNKLKKELKDEKATPKPNSNETKPRQSRLAQLRQSRVQDRPLETATETANQNAETETPVKPKTVDVSESRVGRLIKGIDRVNEQGRKIRDDVSFTRGLGQRMRKDRIEVAPPTEVKKHYKETVVKGSRLDALLNRSTASNAASFKRVERQMDVDDSHLTENEDYNAHAQYLEMERKANEDENAESPFKIIEYDMLDDSQKEAVDADHPHMIINGPAGTGKSTVLAAKVQKQAHTVDMLPVSELRRNSEHVGKPIRAVAFIAFTGKAVQNMRERLPEEFREYNCMTSHRMLGYYPDEVAVKNDKTGEIEYKRRFIPAFNSDNPLKFQTIYIDEAGMLPPKLMNEIIIAAPNAQIIFVGDSAQLPATQGVAPFNVYMATLPIYTLTKVHRTSEDDLVVNATRIREGLEPEWNEKNAFYKPISNRAEFAEGQVFSAVHNLHKAGRFDPKIDTIIVTNNDHKMGQINLNEKLRLAFNPDAEPVRINALTHVARYAIGDKVMCKANNDPQGLTNGMIGWVVDIQRNGNYVRPDRDAVVDASDFDMVYEAAVDNGPTEPGQRECSHIVYVHFPTCYAENKIVPIHTQGGYSALGLGYVTTCHKAQGSEYRNVVVIVHASGKILLNREWFYTAWTRAKERCFVLGDRNSIQRVRNKQSLVGDTAEEKAQNYFNKYRNAVRLNTQRFYSQTMGTGIIDIHKPEDTQFNINRPVFIGDYNE